MDIKLHVCAKSGDNEFCGCPLLCYAVLCVHSSFGIILMVKQELVTLL